MKHIHSTRRRIYYDYGTGGSRGDAKKFHPVMDEVCEILPDLLQPAVTWCLTEKEAISEGTVILRDPLSGNIGRLCVGDRYHFLEPAKYVVLGEKTIGPFLEKEVRHLGESDPSKSYILDLAGAIAVDRVSDWFRMKRQDMARGRDWGVSPLFLPGSLAGWLVEGQGEICHCGVDTPSERMLSLPSVRS